MFPLLPSLAPHTCRHTAKHCPLCGQLLFPEPDFAGPNSKNNAVPEEVNQVLISGSGITEKAVTAKRGMWETEMVKWHWQLLNLAPTAKPRSHGTADDMSIEMPGKDPWEETKPLGITMQYII